MKKIFASALAVAAVMSMSLEASAGNGDITANATVAVTLTIGTKVNLNLGTALAYNATAPGTGSANGVVNFDTNGTWSATVSPAGTTLAPLVMTHSTTTDTFNATFTTSTLSGTEGAAQNITVTPVAINGLDITDRAGAYTGTVVITITAS